MTIFATLAAVLIASLAGSVHCAGMCGGLVLFATNADGTLRKSRILHAAYHAGRGLAYSALGALAGLLGATADIAAFIDGNARTSALIAGGLMVFIGLVALAQHVGVKGLHAKLPAPMQRFTENAHRRAMALPPLSRAAAVGLLTPLLPCGWLYAFVIVAAGTGHPASGAAVMLAFWLGTVPILAALGMGIDKLAAPLKKRLPAVTSLIVVALGVMTAMGRVNVPTGMATTMSPTIAEGSADERLHAVEQIGHEDLPCCALMGAPSAPKAAKTSEDDDG
ncbi:MAG: sulfite exporter TauE/SafE family protein [Planctomycetota bacterium]